MYGRYTHNTKQLHPWPNDEGRETDTNASLNNNMFNTFSLMDIWTSNIWSGEEVPMVHQQES